MSETDAALSDGQTRLGSVEQVTTRCAIARRAGLSVPEQPFGIVAIGASAGGISALKALVLDLSPDFPVPILVCQHVRRDRPSRLPEILGHRSRLRVVRAEQGDVPALRSIYVAPSNRHLLVLPDGRLGLSDGERVNHCRPSADILFRSIAEVYGPRALAVILTGYGRDGAQGIRTVQRCGGFAISQDEGSSEVFDMPLAARDVGGADLVLPLGQIAAALGALVGAAPQRE